MEGREKRPEAVSKTNAEHYVWGNQCDGWHLLKSPELSVIQEGVPPGGIEVRHYHRRARQFFFVLSGVARLEVAGEVLNLGAGQSCHVPAGIPHQLYNEGPERLEFLVVSVPMAHGDRVLAASQAKQSAAADGLAHEEEAEMRVTIQKAAPEEIRAVSAILSEAARYLEDIGQPLWNREELTSERLAEDVLAGRYCLARWKGEAVGTFKFQLEDKLFWPDIRDDSSAYIHRLAVTRKAASKGVSGQMLDWAKKQAKAMGRDYLRLDCAPRPKLCALYERHGFKKHSERQVGPYHVVRFEMALTHLDTKDEGPSSGGEPR